MNNFGQETQFNAGLSIAEEIDLAFKKAAYFMKQDEFDMAYNELEYAEIRMWSNIQKEKDAKEQIGNAKTLVLKDVMLFKKKKNLGKKNISSLLTTRLKNSLDEYHKILGVWRDSMGYGMPSKKNIMMPSSQW